MSGAFLISTNNQKSYDYLTWFHKKQKKLFTEPPEF
jgi:hypothetical protein